MNVSECLTDTALDELKEGKMVKTPPPDYICPKRDVVETSMPLQKAMDREIPDEKQQAD